MIPHDNRIDLIRPDAPELARLGHHPVGVKTLELVNPAQVDVLAALAGNPAVSDRKLVVELWYPAAERGAGATYATVSRDGRTPVRLSGRLYWAWDRRASEGMGQTGFSGHGTGGLVC